MSSDKNSMVCMEEAKQFQKIILFLSFCLVIAINTYNFIGQCFWRDLISRVLLLFCDITIKWNRL